MTLTMGLSAEMLADTEAQMSGPCSTRISASLLDYANRVVIPDLDTSRVSGSVQVKPDPDGVSRSLSMEMFDPTDVLRLGAGTTTVPPNRMLSIRKGVYVEKHSRWVDFPIFWGPITEPHRGGDLLTIKAQDVSYFALDHRAVYSLKAGTNVATAMKQVMRDVVGINRFRMGTTTKKLSKTHNLGPDYTPWEFIQKAAKSIGWVAYCDAEGYFVAKVRPTAPVATFRTGPGGLVASKVETDYWTKKIKNRVVVTGKVVGGVKVQAIVKLDDSHPLSAVSLAVGDPPVLNHQTEYVDDEDLATIAECTAVGKQRLAQLALQATSAQFETQPWWHIEEYDPYLVQAQDGFVTAATDETTISFDGTAQSWGFLKSTPKTAAFNVKNNSARVRDARRRAKAKAARQKAGAKK